MFVSARTSSLYLFFCVFQVHMLLYLSVPVQSIDVLRIEWDVKLVTRRFDAFYCRSPPC